MDIKKHVVQHPRSANEDTKAQNGEWFNFLKVKPYGMGAGGERMGCLFHQQNGGQKTWLHSARAFVIPDFL